MCSGRNAHSHCSQVKAPDSHQRAMLPGSTRQKFLPGKLCHRISSPRAKEVENKVPISTQRSTSSLCQKVGNCLPISQSFLVEHEEVDLAQSMTHTIGMTQPIGRDSCMDSRPRHSVELSDCRNVQWNFLVPEIFSEPSECRNIQWKFLVAEMTQSWQFEWSPVSNH